jgi:NAD(P)-dependent dehydrogenase (short-subunit alcohol dehydrogenase family)
VSLDFAISGRRAPVPGATRGVGAAVVDTLSALGAHILATARSVPAEAPDGVHWVAADFTTIEGGVGA